MQFCYAECNEGILNFHTPAPCPDWKTDNPYSHARSLTPKSGQSLLPLAMYCLLHLSCH